MGDRCQVAKATYRDFLEQRARENAVDFMVKNYETLVASDTRVDVNTGIVAACRLQAGIGSRDYRNRYRRERGTDSTAPGPMCMSSNGQFGLRR